VTDDAGQIRQLIARFANAFDLKAWDAPRNCRYDVERRTASRPTIWPCNPESTVEGARGRCRTSMVVWRRDERGAFDTHCLYFLEVARAEHGGISRRRSDSTCGVAKDVTSVGGRVSA